MTPFFCPIKAVALSLALLAPASTVLAQQGNLAQPTTATGAPTSYPITTAATASGITLTHLQIGDAREEHVRFVWRDRSIQHQPDSLGVYALATETMLASGIAGLDGGALQEEMMDLNAGLSLSRGAGFTFGGFSASSADIPRVSQLFATLVQEPRLSEVQLRRRKRFLLNSLEASDKKPENYAPYILRKATYGSHPLGRLTDYEPRDLITQTSIADMQAWRQARLKRDNLHVFVVSKMPRDEAARLVDATVAGLDVGSANEPIIPLDLKRFNKTVVLLAEVPQTRIQIGAPTSWVGSGAEAIGRGVAMTVLGSGFQSRLFVAVREKLGAAYGASANTETLVGQTALFSMQAAVQHDKALEALQAFRSEYAKFRETGVTAAEVDPIKVRFQSGFKQSMRNAASAISTIVGGYTAGFGPDRANRYDADMAGVNAEQINALIREKLPQTMLTIIVAPKDIGFNADCVVRTEEEALACIGQ